MPESIADVKSEAQRSWSASDEMIWLSQENLFFLQKIKQVFSCGSCFPQPRKERAFRNIAIVPGNYSTP
jgi:hypothetical protein